MKALAINDKVLKAGVLALSFTPSFAHAVVGCSAADENPVTSPNPIASGSNCAQSKSNTNSLFGTTGIFHTIADTLIYIVGAVAVIMLIIGGLRYVISQGSKEGVASAKDTILYAVIGIVVAILAYAIVSFVTGSLTTPSTASGS
ncbi:MAG TPA: pilin [Candidatus Saccharimonadales bacterium]|nr:pilin [Candidatus Saccharimonadales bacterium]